MTAGRLRRAGLLVVVLVAGASGCAGDGDPSSAAAVQLPSQHVHAVAVDPADESVYLATHDGLFDVSGAEPERVGPVIDLMGFTVAGPNHFYASGHPGPGTNLPQPVGLIESTDAGRTWTAISRGGVSDFHTLTASAAGVAGFDGALRTSSDGVSWDEFATPAQPFDLAASPDGASFLATTEVGLLASNDAGESWSPVDRAPVLLLTEWADADVAVGATPEGEVFTSADGGETWEPVGDVGSAPQALGVHRTDDGALRILLVTATSVLDSTDGGQTFEPLRVGP